VHLRVSVLHVKEESSFVAPVRAIGNFEEPLVGHTQIMNSW